MACIAFTGAVPGPHRRPADAGGGEPSGRGGPRQIAGVRAARRTLEYGMHGDDVRALAATGAARCYPGPADGQFGADTLEAVSTVQEVQG